jgi:hypothetical protein
VTTPTTLKRLQNLIWVLVYGGLLTLVLGLATQRFDAALGGSLAVGGGIVAAIGFVLIYVRSRLKETP